MFSHLYAIDKAFLALLDRKQNPITNSALPVSDTALADLHSHNPNVGIDAQARPSLARVLLLLTKESNFLLLERIILQMPLFAPFLFL
jgi:hypothetical protein